jgi:hypothetical protein
VQLGGAGGRPTTPTYQAPSFPPNNQASAPGGGYNYPGPADDYPASPTGPAINNAPYPASQRPSAPGGFGGSSPYPAPGGQGPTGGSSYPSGPAAGPTAVSRPGPVAQSPAVFGGAQSPAVFGGAQSPAVFGGAPTGSAGGFGQSVGGGNIPGTSVGSSASRPTTSVQNDDASEGDYSAIPGSPDTDYPIYSEIPETSFDCNQQQYPGENHKSNCAMFT